MGMPEPRSHAAKAGLPSRAGVATVKNENRHPSEPNPNFAAIFPLALQTTPHGPDGHAAARPATALFDNAGIVSPGIAPHCMQHTHNLAQHTQTHRYLSGTILRRALSPPHIISHDLSPDLPWISTDLPWISTDLPWISHLPRSPEYPYAANRTRSRTRSHPRFGLILAPSTRQSKSRFSDLIWKVRGAELIRGSADL